MYNYSFSKKLLAIPWVVWVFIYKENDGMGNQLLVENISMQTRQIYPTFQNLVLFFFITHKFSDLHFSWGTNINVYVCVYVWFVFQGTIMILCIHYARYKAAVKADPLCYEVSFLQSFDLFKQILHHIILEKKLVNNSGILWGSVPPELQITGRWICFLVWVNT